MPAAVGPVEIDARRGMVFVTTSEEMPGGLTARKRYVTSGCGRGLTFTSAGHLTNVEPVESDLTSRAEDIYEMMGQMARGAQMYRDTGGIHACALGLDGRVELVREDMGRHNALDKVLGVAWLRSAAARAIGPAHERQHLLGDGHQGRSRSRAGGRLAHRGDRPGRRGRRPSWASRSLATRGVASSWSTRTRSVCAKESAS